MSEDIASAHPDAAAGVGEPGSGAPWDSLLSAQEFAALAGVGFEPVGQVLGTTVVHLGYASRAGKCSGRYAYTLRTDLASVVGGPFGARLRKLYGVRRTALSRALEECGELGGDGIIGATLSIRPFPAGGTEFTVQGTAVRARSTIRPAAPFGSHLSAQDFARLLRSGWVPAALVFGIALGARHDDMHTRRETRRWTVADREVRSYTALVRDTRRDAREQLEREVAAVGADGVVVDGLTLQISERACPTQEGQHDHVAVATILGTAVVAFEQSRRAVYRAPLTIMHLGSSPAMAPSVAPPAGRDAEEPASEPPPLPEGGFLDRFRSGRIARRVSRSILSTSDTTGVSRDGGLEHDWESGRRR